jgi:large subunit ribosomal protein L9
MKIILTQNVPHLGKLGDIKNVADGYAVNFLFPKKMAVAATEKNIEISDKQRAENEKMEKDLAEKMQSLAKKIEGEKFSIQAKSKNGKLFGSISEKEIAQVIQEKGVEINPKQIILSQPIRETGKHKLKVKIHKDIFAHIELEVSGN